MERERKKSLYKEAGVDIDAGERAVVLMKKHVASTLRPEVLGGLGGFLVSLNWILAATSSRFLFLVLTVWGPS